MSKKLIKISAISICIIAAFFITASCGSTLNNKIDKKLKNEGESILKEKIRFWMRAATKNSVTGKLVEKYNLINKDNVEIEFEVYGENYKNVVTMALASGNPPDVFELNGGLNIQQLAQADHIIPIDRFVDDAVKKDIYAEALNQKQFYYQGKMYTIPERSAFLRLMYNKDIFRKAGIKEPPKTLEELIDYAARITSEGRGEYYGYCSAMKTNSTIGRYTDSICSISGLTGEAAFDWSTGRFDFMKQKRALEVLVQMQKQNILYPGSLNLDIEVARVKFAQGKIGMMIDGNWMVGVYGNNEINCNIDWDSTPIPVFKDDRRGKDYMFFDMGKLISSRSKSPEKAWNFIKFLLDNQEEFVRNGEPLRTSIKANMRDNIPLNYKGVKGFTDIENSKAFPLQVQDFLTRLEGDKYDKVYQDVVAGETDIDTGLEDLNRRYNAALDKAVAEGIISLENIKIPGFDYFDYYNK